MKQSIWSGISHSVPYDALVNQFAEHEIAVTDIMLDLKHLVPIFDTRNRLSLSWGAKRRRSAINSSPSPSGVLAPPSSPSLWSPCEVETERDAIPEVKVVASSPATPLSFSPSESDEKPKHPHGRKFKKKTREEWLESIHGLIQCRESLKREVDTVRSYYDHLKAQNLELKAMKQELITRSNLEKENPNLGMKKSLNLGMEVCQASGKAEHQEHYPVLMVTHQGPFVVDQTAYGSQMNEKFKYPFTHTAKPVVASSGGGLVVVNHMGPGSVIPDLNLSVEQTFRMEPPQPLDLSRALADNRAKAAAADARKKRMLKIKETRNSCVAAVKTQRFR